MTRTVIVGAGPAGIRAAQTLVEHGLRPVLLDEAARAGGQIYRRPPANFERPAEALYGTEAGRAKAVHAAIDGIADRIDYRPGSLVWNAQAGSLDVLDTATSTSRAVPYDRLIVATGATDRVLPVPGWTLPGTYSLGGSQVALKFQGCTIGRQVVFMGSGPLLYLVAYQYAKAGAQVVAVLDTATLADQAAASPRLLTKPATLAKGLYYLGWLRTHGVALHRGVRPVRVLGSDRVTGVVFHDGQSERTLSCDAVGFGHALRSETQLADLLGCRFAFSPVQRAHLPERDAAGRSSVEGVYLAGDGAGIQGADAAEWAGERAALALLQDEGMTVDPGRVSLLENRLSRIGVFRRGLERAFPFPEDWAAQAPDELVVCRCENITAGELRATVRDTGADEMNRLKALSRIGMGRCQGRMCGVAAAELLAHAAGVPIAQVGRLRGQAPIKPIPLGLSAGPEAAA
ncbi:FAD-dependent oxidoreductase [Xylophilus rhododendri]|uniref:FAD-dependent oxidoreductase n=1 Tax=Xylophilus rhododendri TaxID=2697032 RepID=A0A857J9A7_9BURK|nr:FAD-dependent oxidoreductase [Xylophilus rhododendri]QHJ00621.1 FAD-dependent oxidoreductase [Xylophilus rhododendri]